MTNYDSLVDGYGVYSYKDDLIFYKIENFRDWRHRELRVQKDWLFNAYIKKLDEEIFTERPIFTPDIFGGMEIRECSYALKIPKFESLYKVTISI